MLKLQCYFNKEYYTLLIACLSLVTSISIIAANYSGADI